MLNDKRRHESKEDRVAREMKLREKGLSFRAIADVVGVHHTTVLKDLKAGGDMSPPEPEPDHEPAAPEQPEVKLDPKPELPKVTGLDGKS